jgi:hypothetical protein
VIGGCGSGSGSGSGKILNLIAFECLQKVLGDSGSGSGSGSGVRLRVERLCAAGRVLLLSPPLVLLCVAGAIRNGAGIVSAYNVVNFFAQYHPQVVVSA